MFIGVKRALINVTLQPKNYPLYFDYI